MAQWLGQFSGNTHATKVQDAEAALRHAVTVFHATDSSEARANKAKAVRGLATRLLSARLRLLKARISAAEDHQLRHAGSPNGGIESLRLREAKMRVEGLNAVLVEFGVSDLIA
ncbi:MAG TPA: hypothetical protein VN688_14215 [Gemmataceae bacterium]|nr:hypothetical protein [Gemmataceae bacterium]